MKVAEPRELGKSRNGFLANEVAQTSFNVLIACMGIESKWEENDQQAWDRIATVAIRLVDDNIESEGALSARQFACDLFCLAYGPEAIENWPEIDDRQKKAWETVGRHIVNLLDAESGSVNVAEMERRSVAWFKKHFMES